MHHHIDSRLYPQTNKDFRILYNYSGKVDQEDENQLDFYEPLDFKKLRRDTE